MFWTPHCGAIWVAVSVYVKPSLRSRVSAQERALEHSGLTQVDRGDHEVWGNDTGLTFPVDGAGGIELKTGTLNAILRQAGITLEPKRKKRQSKT